ncbi:cleft lip and palate transmembrane protein 1 (clptm1) protein [Cryptosporidium felis]|nr:cleft lip and palate transmembrane protein 1 (clptm1) protein [Cryptosporidium felis]
MSNIQDSSTPTISENGQNSWFSGIVSTIIRIIFFQMVMKYFIGGQKSISNSTNELIKPLSNYFKPGDIYDLHAHILFGYEESIANISFDDINKIAYRLENLETIRNISSIIEVWSIKNLVYNDLNTEISKNISIALPPELFEYDMENTSNIYNNLSAFLIVSLIGKNKNNFIPMSYVDLTKTMNRLNDEDSLVSLLDQNNIESSNNQPYSRQVRYWKDNINIRIVYDNNEYNIGQRNKPPLSYMKYNVIENVYLPIVYPSDFWCIESNLKIMNETTKNENFYLLLTFNTFSLFKYTIQRQMMDTWELQSRYGLGQSQKDIMMIKRILVETNKYYLIFSLLFFILHSSFQMLAFKNDISFWNNNDSMYGLSGLSILASFISELIIGLYLFDSNETSWILLIEIFIGIAISAWKLWKTRIFSFTNFFPFIVMKSDPEVNIDSTGKLNKERIEQEKLSRHYDSIAIKYMSIMLIPCISAYAGYSLKYHKFRNWYSFIISTLAGTVYTFGFIMMTPQLYINYKLKSVDHLPWRFLIYKALNTFIDDIFSFIIDMPWMHRLACFRDDIIFIAYIYQRWIYRNNNKRKLEIETERVLDSNSDSNGLGNNRDSD